MGNIYTRTKSDDVIRLETFMSGFHHRLGEASPVSIISPELITRTITKLFVRMPPVAIVSYRSDNYPVEYGALLVFPPKNVIELPLPSAPFSDKSGHDDMYRQQHILSHTGKSIVIASVMSQFHVECHVTTISIFKCNQFNEQPTLINCFSYYNDYPKPCASDNWVVYITKNVYNAVNIQTGIHLHGLLPTYVDRIYSVPSDPNKFYFCGRKNFTVSFTHDDCVSREVHLPDYSLIMGNYMIFIGYSHDKSLLIQTTDINSNTVKITQIITPKEPGYIRGFMEQLSPGDTIPRMSHIKLSETTFCLAEEYEKYYVCAMSYEYKNIYMWEIDPNGQPILLRKLSHFPRQSSYLDNYLISQSDVGNRHILNVIDLHTGKKLSVPLPYKSPHRIINHNEESDLHLTECYNYEYL
jgi:hypothetical protein